MSASTLIDTSARDVRFAVRMLRKSPAFAILLVAASIASFGSALRILRLDPAKALRE